MDHKAEEEEYWRGIHQRRGEKRKRMSTVVASYVDFPQHFAKALDENLEDWVTKMAIADWYEEQGHYECAKCMRWAIANKKRPYSALGKSFIWFISPDDKKDSETDPGSDIPLILYTLLVGFHREFFKTKYHYDAHKVYVSRQDAEQALVKAWCRGVVNGVWVNVT